jgi:hypothetical protein
MSWRSGPHDHRSINRPDEAAAVKAKQAGENHDMIRDRGARLWDLTSLTELTMDQARQLIEIYDDLIKPPEPSPPVVMGRGAFGGLPKRVTPSPAAAPSRPAKVLDYPDTELKEPVRAYKDTFSAVPVVKEMLATPRWCTPDGSKPDLVIQNPRSRLKKAVHNFTLT